MNLFKNRLLVTASTVALVMASCGKDTSNVPDEPTPPATKEFQLAFASGSGSISGTYLQGVSSLTEGTITFDGRGSHISDARTSRIFPSEDGKYIYSLSFTQGTIDKWEFNGGSNYKKLQTLDASVPLQEKRIRFYKLNENEGSLHFITGKPVLDGTTYKHHEMTLTIGILDFNTMSVKANPLVAVPFTMPGDLASQGYNITRIDCPVLSNGKLYYGAALSKYDPARDRNIEADKAMTFVVDYPSLANPTVIETTLATGSTNGYRTPTQQVNEKGEVLQMVNKRSGSTAIVKLVNGKYDDSFVFKLDEALGRPGKTSSNGFFYAGNGIAYMPYEKKHLEQIQIGVDPSGNPTFSSAWGVARIDLNSKTVVDLEVPDGLWLTQWQNSIIRDGKFYIALAPVGQPGHIYIFDVNSTSPKGTKGAATVSGADQYFIGIY